MRIQGAWITHTGTRAVMQALTSRGFEAYFVGGCVRNALLDRPVNDIDISTSAKPDETVACAAEAGLHSVPTGMSHGTITVVAQGIPHEITTYRADVETDGRHAKVLFSKDIAEDAARRDFTMNALYADQEGQVVDPLGGLPDLLARRLRFVGAASDRIREDYLRSLRFFRFAAWYADPSQGMDSEALDAIARNLDGLAQLSKERVGAEITKLLSATDPAPAVSAMARTGVLARVLPGAEPQMLAPLVHLESMAQAAPDPMRRLAILGWQDPETLRLSKKHARHLQQLAEGVASTQTPEELGFYLGKDLARDILLLRAASFGTPWQAEDMARAQAAAMTKCPVTAKDLLDDYRGAELGRRLQHLQGLWLASGMTLDRAALLDAP